MKFADLHLHTNVSDGTFSADRLVGESVKAGLDCIAITDHDTVDAVGPALEAARSKGVEVLPAIEFSAEYRGLEVHILGYLIDHHDRNLLEKLKTLKQNRVERVYKIVQKLQGMGVNLRPESIFEFSNNGTVGRLHVARAMVKESKASSVFEAFHKYIGDQCPAYVLGFKFSPSEAIDIIRGAGGIPVLAHPYLLKDDDLIFEFIKMGIAGLEVYYPEHSQSMVNYYLDIARKNNLLVTGGSDCHGYAKPQVMIGSIKVPYELVIKLKEAKQRCP